MSEANSSHENKLHEKGPSIDIHHVKRLWDHVTHCNIDRWETLQARCLKSTSQTSGPREDLHTPWPQPSHSVNILWNIRPWFPSRSLNRHCQLRIDHSVIRAGRLTKFLLIWTEPLPRWLLHWSSMIAMPCMSRTTLHTRVSITASISKATRQGAVEKRAPSFAWVLETSDRFPLLLRNTIVPGRCLLRCRPCNGSLCSGENCLLTLPPCFVLLLLLGRCLGGEWSRSLGDLALFVERFGVSGSWWPACLNLSNSALERASFQICLWLTNTSSRALEKVENSLRRSWFNRCTFFLIRVSTVMWVAAPSLYSHDATPRAQPDISVGLLPLWTHKCWGTRAPQRNNAACQAPELRWLLALVDQPPPLWSSHLLSWRSQTSGWPVHS